MTAVAFDTFVHQLATVSGEAILPFFRTALSIEDKSRGRAFDPVTEADRAAEQAMRQLITTTFPDHGIIGEEFDNLNPDAPYVWALDPIDGTKSFIAGLPAWGTLIGLLKESAAVYGMMHQPFIGERFFGDGRSARYQGPAGERALFTRDCERLEDAVLYTTSPRLMDEADRAAFERVEARVRLSRYGGDCYAYCMVAAGLIDLVIETNLQDHDVIALVPIIEGAGGVVTNWEGGSAVAGGRVVAAGSRKAHAAALKALGA
ncbi:histidinol-phosphatase [Xanthobacter tagetidis]|jgi:myo-inositol-1(or 4)-monophosphatase|uniref:Histidinol-phosphatase n=1 Tax=Xanthobacter tagetidis TaxID=60216 RepID=A0A3L7AIF5_9HYPH|nr:histidinol-phosphatase [Xanthobacter tagetidis]MBB6306929.1 myo-inositol-1(or 4)-monophosphatase [Xanthobacter tagetidis]RLP80007.1 histidinol-phosphatase [Xanthobacter tagetidis]